MKRFYLTAAVTEAAREKPPVFSAPVRPQLPTVQEVMTMGTAATMMSLAETLGLSLPGASSIPAVHSAHARMATEAELSRLFPDCQLGAMPPFGPCYGMPVYLDGSLACQKTLTFNSGTHREVIHMRTAEFQRLVAPYVVSLVRETEHTHHW